MICLGNAPRDWQFHRNDRDYLVLFEDVHGEGYLYQGVAARVFLYEHVRHDGLQLIERGHLGNRTAVEYPITSMEGEIQLEASVPVGRQEFVDFYHSYGLKGPLFPGQYGGDTELVSSIALTQLFEMIPPDIYNRLASSSRIQFDIKERVRSGRFPGIFEDDIKLSRNMPASLFRFDDLWHGPVQPWPLIQKQSPLRRFGSFHGGLSGILRSLGGFHGDFKLLGPGSFRVTDQIPSGAPKENRSEAENTRSNGQNQRSESDPELIVKRKEAIEAREPSWPPILAAFFVLAPVFGAVFGFMGRGRRSLWLCIGFYTLWLLGILGLGIMVGLG